MQISENIKIQVEFQIGRRNFGLVGLWFQLAPIHQGTRSQGYQKPTFKSLDLIFDRVAHVGPTTHLVQSLVDGLKLEISNSDLVSLESLNDLT